MKTKRSGIDLNDVAAAAAEEKANTEMLFKSALLLLQMYVRGMYWMYCIQKSEYTDWEWRHLV